MNCINTYTLCGTQITQHTKYNKIYIELKKRRTERKLNNKRIYNKQMKFTQRVGICLRMFDQQTT